MKGTIARVLLAGCVAASFSSACQAQHFSFGFSSGHHHHHRHHHGCWHDHCWGPWWGPSVGFVYAPPPVVQERVIYVQPPPRTNPWTAPVNPSISSSDSSAAARISIRNASGARLPVAFLVDGQDVELRDGEERTFSGQAHRTVHYDRGGSFGNTQQELGSGDYEFRITPSGWDLVRRPDNSASSRTAVRANTLPQAATPR
jgi:hypothetical protein